MKSACVENKKWEVGSSKKIVHEIAKKLKNWEELVAKNHIEQIKQGLTNCLCIKRGILRLWVNYWLRFGNYGTKVNSLSDAREKTGPESGSSSGATHVPGDPRSWSTPYYSESQNFAALRFWIAAWFFKIVWVLQETSLIDYLLKKDTSLHASTIQRIRHRPLRNWGLVPRELEGRERVCEMKRESLNTSIPLPHFHRSGKLNHTGGISSHSGMMDYPRIPFWKCILENFMTLWNFNAGQSTSRMRYGQEQPILRSQCSGSKKLRLQSRLTNLRHRDRLWSELISLLRYAWCDDCVCIETAS